MRPGKVAIALAAVALLLVAACAPRDVTSPVPMPEKIATKLAPAEPGPASEGWQEEWTRLVAAARREGKLVLYNTIGAEMRQVTEPFRVKYGISIEALSARGGELAAKLQKERGAGIYTADAYIGGTSTITASLKPAAILATLEPALMLPEVINPQLWWEGKFPWFDPDHTAVAFLLYPNQALGVNTQLVKPEEMRSYRDLLDPKWKGKIVMSDPTISGVASGVVTAVGAHIVNWDFWRELVAKQELKVMRDERLMVEWLAHGKYPLAIAPKTEPIVEFMKAGAPIRMWYLKEGTYLTSGSGAIGLVDRAPHPSAAKVFINWLLSKEGGTIWTRTLLNQSARVDVPSDHLPPEKLRQPGEKYYDGWSEEYKLKSPELEKLAKDIFETLLK